MNVYFIFSKADKPKVSYPTGWDDEVYYSTPEGIAHCPPRTKISHPYGYDPIVMLNNGVEGNGSAYTDRMVGWDREKYYSLIEKHFKNERVYWGDRDKVQAFIRDYNDDKTLELCKVVEYCDASSGYPTWLLVWKSSKK